MPKPDEPRYTTDQLPCPHRGDVRTTVDCGCGRPGERTPIYRCGELGLCTLQGVGKPLPRIEGFRVVVCLGCGKNPNGPGPLVSGETPRP